MEIPWPEKSIARAHRMGMATTAKKEHGTASQETRQIVAKFEYSKHRELVWEKRIKLKGSGIYREENYPPEIKTHHCRLYPKMKAANAYLDHTVSSPYKARLACTKS